MSHVFISYVREDADTVGSIVRALRAYGVKVWLDKQDIKPGARWADAIRDAITAGAFYMACFSTAYNLRTRSYMNEELTLAIEELRQRGTDQRWFIPVLLDDCEIPQRSIGAGETLRSLQWVRLYESWNDAIARILSTVQPDAAEVHRLIVALHDPSARARIRAADRLAELGSLAEVATDGLVEALDDENETVRAAAADALGKLRVDREAVVNRLRDVLRAGEHYSSRTASNSLARLGAVGVPALLEATTSTAYGVAHHASDGLSQVSDPAAVPLLIDALNTALSNARDCRVIDSMPNAHSGPHVARSICEALGRVGDPEAVAALSRAQESRCEWTREAASAAIASITESRNP
jgi:HEAT repeat protein